MRKVISKCLVCVVSIRGVVVVAVPQCTINNKIQVQTWILVNELTSPWLQYNLVAVSTLKLNTYMGVLYVAIMYNLVVENLTSMHDVA